MSISSFGERHPYWFAGALEIGVVAVFLGIFLILKRLLSAVSPSDIDLLLNAIAYSLLAVVTAVLLRRLHWWKSAGFQRPARWSFVLLFWLPILPLALNLIGGLKIASFEPWRIVVLLLVSVLVGFVEEGLFRGLMVQALLSKGVWTAAVVSTLLFGLAHSVNFALGENVQAVALQLVYTTMIYGFGSAALVIYTKTIWPIVVIHALIDFTAWLQAGTTLKTTGVTFGDVFITVVGSALAIGYGVLLLILANRSERVLSTTGVSARAPISPGGST